MQAKLIISDAKLDLETIQDLTREFSLALGQEAGLEAVLESASIKPNEKGGEIAVGQIALEWLKKIEVSKIIDLIKEFFARTESMVITFEDPSGRKVSITIQKRDLKDSHIKNVLGQLEVFFESTP